MNDINHEVHIYLDLLQFEKSIFFFTYNQIFSFFQNYDFFNISLVNKNKKEVKIGTIQK